MSKYELKDWLTCAERTNWEETSRYSETIRYCLRLQECSPWIRYTTFGVSPQQRDLPLLIVSSRGVGTPDEARESGLPLILIINGIHSGEIAGKEASFMLLRDMAILQEKKKLLERVNLLVVPIFNTDGHERCSPFNRINQNGPREMGWRATAHNLNLNRDWMKADQPEMQAMLRLYNTWMPDLVIDNHVTDGGDWLYDITYILDDDPRVADPVRHYMKRYLEPYLESYLRERGHVPMSYFEFTDTNDPTQGILAPPLSARFSDGYGTVQNRPTIVVETHMLKSFRTRIRAHYNLMCGILEKVNKEPEVLRSAVTAADAASAQIGAAYDPAATYPISVDLTEEGEPFLFEGVEFAIEQSEASGGPRIVYGPSSQRYTVPYRHTCYADREITPPLGYIVPVEWDLVIERLALHGVEFDRLTAELNGTFETYRFSDVFFPAAPYEGRQMPQCTASAVMERRTLPAGSAVIRLNQRRNRLILGLLEPDSCDSFLAWGFFNSIFETKEYAEPYILERLADRMLEDSADLRREFQSKLLKDEDFAASPAARLKFFYERSPYMDPWKDAYPVVRITRQEQLEL